MDKQKNDIQELIARWLAGEASDIEIQYLNAWAEESPENLKMLQSMETIWNEAEEQISEDRTEKAWNTIQPRLKEGNRLKVIYRAAAVMAACLGLFVAGRLIWQYQTGPSEVTPASKHALFIQAGNQPFSTTLSDGTQILLQAYSSISADSGFGKQHRSLQLTGAAHFTTTHGHNSVFTVHCGNLTVEDIGTAFTVTENNDRVAVKVTEGKVRVLSQKDSAMMVKGDSAVLDRLGDKLRVIKEKTVEKAAEVKDKIIEFQKTELKKVGQMLSTLYQTEIRLSNPAIENCKLTARFDNESLDTVLEVIQETFNLEIKRKGNVVYLDGKGCQ